MNELVAVSHDREIGILTVNNPPVNALSPEVLDALDKAIRQSDQDNQVRAIVVIGGGRTFIAGADIKEFGKMTSGQSQGPAFHQTLNRIEDSSKPVVAAIHGTALGGGLETAMACHYRVALPSAQVGQPEVKLGIIPGAGGTQRLPRLAGVPDALKMCVGGEPVSAAEALRLGIIDRIVEQDLLHGAIEFARDKIGAPPRRTREQGAKLGTEAQNAAIFASARTSARTLQRNLIAPLAVIDAIEASTRLPFLEGLAREAALFRECLFSDQSKALIHVFFGEREVAKIPGLAIGPGPMDFASGSQEAGALFAAVGITASISGRLVEIMRRPETTDQAVATAMALAKKLGKIGVLVVGERGIRERLLEVYTREAQELMKDGASREAVDQALQDFGMTVLPPTAPGAAGMKNISPLEIVKRVTSALAREGARILEEGAALRPVDIDIVSIHGCGFPAYRGGVMWYAAAHTQ